jgi:hypothetical protein
LLSTPNPLSPTHSSTAGVHATQLSSPALSLWSGKPAPSHLLEALGSAFASSTSVTSPSTHCPPGLLAARTAPQCAPIQRHRSIPTSSAHRNHLPLAATAHTPTPALDRPSS